MASESETSLEPWSDGVVVILSSYNGARFIAEQIESIRRQSFTGWRLLVRDDGSSDDTPNIVERLARVDPRIHLLRDGDGNLGVAASFGALLERAAELKARYVAFADQDDVWQPHKLARELELLQRREAETGAATPLLVHSDLTVVAENLHVIHPSFLAFQHLGHRADWPIGAMLVQNFVTGCTALFNNALLQAAVPIPQVVMHDWWFGLCAAALGEILYLPEATVLYRQHDRNTIGSKGWPRVCRESIQGPFTWWRESGGRFAAAVRQAGELGRRLASRTDVRSQTPAQEALSEFAHAFGGGAGALRRLWAVRRHRIRPQTLLPYPVFFYLRVLLWSSAPAPQGRPATRQRSAPGGDPHRTRRPAIFNPKDGHA
jgi:rhamnosyltransferase